MRIISQTNWFDEDPASLRRLIASIAPVVDFAVFVDGPYESYPYEFERSPDEQWDAIEAACFESGLSFLRAGGRVYESQVVKRTEMFKLATQYGVVNDDYTLVIDADEWIYHVNVERLRTRLERHHPDAGQVKCDTPRGKSYSAQSAIAMRGIQQPKFSTSVHGKGVERIFKLVDDPIVGPNYHGEYRGTNEHGERVVLKQRGAPRPDELQGSRLDLTDVLSIRNETWSRSMRRIRAKDQYGKKRTDLGVDL